MKSFLFFVCLALVQGAPSPDADADPALFYSTGTNYPYAAAAYHHGGVHPTAVVPNVHAAAAYHHGGVHPAAVLPTAHAAFPYGIVSPVVHQAVVKTVEVTPAEVESVVTPVTQAFRSPYNFPLSYPYANGAYPYTTGAYAFSPYATAPLSNVGSVSRDFSAGAPSYIANSGGALHVVNKREADAEADADADADPALFYSTGTNYPYAAAAYHHGGVHPAAVVPTAHAAAAYHHGGVHTAGIVPAIHAAFPHGIVTPVVHQAVVKNVEVTPAEIKNVVTPVTHTYSPYNFPLSYPYANGALPYTTGAYPYTTGAYSLSPYATALSNIGSVSRDIAAGAPSYVANSGGALHVVNKREADPEADADAYYGGYGYGHHYGGYGHSYGYGHHSGYGRAYGYGRRAYSGYHGYPYGSYNRGRFIHF